MRRDVLTARPRALRRISRAALLMHAALLCVALAAATSVQAQPVTADSMAELVPHAPFVFVGTVASPDVPAAPDDPRETRRLVGVRVVESFRAPRGMAVAVGERLQLLVDASNVPKVGTTAIVFATGWLAGDDLSLIEVARFPVRARAEWRAARAMYDSLRHEHARDELQRIVARADLTTLGVVRDVTYLPDTRPPIARSEHAPVWERVALLPLAVYHGDPSLAGRPTTVLIPTNRSHVWARMPRPLVGDTALFILLAVPRGSFYFGIDSTARFGLADSVSVRPPSDTALLRPRRAP